MRYRNALRAALLALPALLAAAMPALPQTQTGVIPGFLAAAGTDGCPAASACFVPYSSTYPLPTTATISGSVTVNIATPVSTSALAANQIIVTGAHQLLSFQVSADSTLSGAAWWIMVYNATTAPADGAVTPTKCYALPSGATAFTGAFFAPVAFSTGIVIGVSSTGCFAKTASTHAFISADYQ